MQESRKPIELDNSTVYSIGMKDQKVAAGTWQVEQTAISSIFSVFLAGSVSDG